MRNKGFTLIESLVVIAILAILAVGGFLSIIEFQKNAILSNTAQELASTLRRAQSMSINGEIPDDPNNPDNLKTKLPSDFDSNGLPKYRVYVTSTSYSIEYEYKLASQPVPVSYPLPQNTFQLDPNLLISTTGTIVNFSRLTGLTTPTDFDFIISRDVIHQIKVSAEENGVITIKSL